MAGLRYVALTSAVLLAGRGGEPAELAELRTSCKADSEMSAAECDCMVDQAKADLTDEQIEMLASVSEGGQPPAALTPDDMTAIMTFVTSAQAECQE